MSFNFDEKTKSQKSDHPRFRSSKFVTVEVNAGAGARLGGGGTSLSCVITTVQTGHNPGVT